MQDVALKCDPVIKFHTIKEEMDRMCRFLFEARGVNSLLSITHSLTHYSANSAHVAVPVAIFVKRTSFSP